MIELLIAGVIISLGSALLIGSLIGANRSADRRIEQAILTQLAASQLALLDNQVTRDLPAAGTIPLPDGDAAWSLQFTDAPHPPLLEANVQVSKGDHTAHVVTWRTLKTPE